MGFEVDYPSNDREFVILLIIHSVGDLVNEIRMKNFDLLFACFQLRFLALTKIGTTSPKHSLSKRWQKSFLPHQLS